MTVDPLNDATHGMGHFAAKPRGESHGHDRGTAAPPHGDTADAADTGDKGTGPATCSGTSTFSVGASAVPHTGNGSALGIGTLLGSLFGSNSCQTGLTAQQAAFYANALSNQHLQTAWRGAFTVSAAFSPSILRVAPKPLEHAGITMGEIIAWRIWLVRPDGFLKSASADSIWVPGEPMTGDVGPDGYGSGGVHAWKSAGQALKYGEHQGPAVIGEIALWGEVVEHSEGYRAEFGRPVSFKWAMGDGARGSGSVWSRLRRNHDSETALALLRERYL